MEPNLDGMNYDCGAMGQFVLLGPEESARRASLVLPEGNSADARHLIESKLPPDLLAPSSDEDDEEELSYSPVNHIAFVIEAELDSLLPAKSGQLKSLENYAWAYRPEMFVFEVGREKWTFLEHRHEDDLITALKFSWSLVDDQIDSETSEWHLSPLSDAEMKDLLSETKNVILKIDPNANVFTNGSIRDSARWADALMQLKQDFDGTVALRLVAGEKWFEGKQVWTVLTSLGLGWGDCDEFHLQNQSNLGADVIFSVGTSTTPGYFIPEDIKDGDMYYEDLQFYFNMARSIAPLDTYSAMLSAVEYAQQQLGGGIVVSAENNPDISWIPQYIEDTVIYLNEFGFVPGDDAAMIFF